MSKTIKVLTVTDLHQVRTLYEQLGKAVDTHRPDIVALVGDFLDLGRSGSDQLRISECAEFLSRLPCQEVVFTRGNHEGDNWWEFFTAWKRTGRTLNALHASTFVFGPLVLVGFPCLLGDDTNYVASTRDGEEGEFYPGDMSAEPGEWMPELLREHGPAARALWLMHEPPSGTPLSRAGTPVEGNPEWVQAIESYSPWLTISGHDHRTPRRTGLWHHRLRRTVCVNVGQTDSGPLHYCVIEADFEKSTPCLPSRMRVFARPRMEALPLPIV